MPTDQVLSLTDIKQKVEANDADLSASCFTDVNLTASAFENVNLYRATINNANLANLQITDSNTAGMTIEGVLVSDLVAAYQKSRT